MTRRDEADAVVMRLEWRLELDCWGGGSSYLSRKLQVEAQASQGRRQRPWVALGVVPGVKPVGRLRWQTPLTAGMCMEHTCISPGALLQRISQWSRALLHDYMNENHLKLAWSFELDESRYSTRSFVVQQHPARPIWL